MITIKQLRAVPIISKVIMHSLDMSLYQVSVLLDGAEHYVTDDKGVLLRSFKILELQALFESLPVEQMVLRQQSAYDEMINQPMRQGSNMLEVPLGNNRLGSAPQILH
tara:strand:- start:2522 stop:2845 length:324 start_codon:yes stop_codon:yes gene_type:complete